MSISRADIQKSGLLTDYDRENGHPEGWTRAVIDKIQADIAAQAATPYGYALGYRPYLYTEEEQAAYRYYTEEVMGNPDRVRERVAQAEREASEYDAFDENGDYVEKPSVNFEPPTVTAYEGPDNKDRQLSVSTEALEYFIRQIDAIAGDGSGMLLDAKKLLDAIDMRPGGFAKAEVLRQRIAGATANDAGLRGDTTQLLRTVHEALYQIKLNLRTLMKEYDSAEDFNALTTEQLGEVMEKAWGKIGSIGDYGRTEGTTAGG